MGSARRDRLHMRCEFCEFYEKNPDKIDVPVVDAPVGECRKNPPTVVVYKLQRISESDTVVDSSGIFPRMPPDGWCGEYLKFTDGY